MHDQGGGRRADKHRILEQPERLRGTGVAARPERRAHRAGDGGARMDDEPAATSGTRRGADSDVAARVRDVVAHPGSDDR